MRADFRTRQAPAEPADARLLEQIIAGENFVSTFARQHDLQALLANKARKLVERGRRGAQDRPFHVPDHRRKGSCDVLGPAGYCVMLRAQRPHHCLLKIAFVEFGVIESDGEGAQAARRHARRKCRDDRGIETAGQKRANLDIGAQPDAGGVFQQRAQLFGDLAFGSRIGKATVFREIQRPVRLVPGLAILDDHQMRRRQFRNALKRGARWDRRPQRENLVKRYGVDLGLDARHLKQGLHLGGKIECATVPGVKERSHPHAVARQQHPPVPLVPDRQGEVAIEARHKIRPVLFIQLENDLGVAHAVEAPAARFQHLAQLDVVEDLAIIGDANGSIRTLHGLGAIHRQVDDRKAPMPETSTFADMNALRIGAAMRNRPAHAPQQRPGSIGRHVAGIAGYAAHGLRSPLYGPSVKPVSDQSRPRFTGKTIEECLPG